MLICIGFHKLIQKELENGWQRAFFAHKMAALFQPFSANKKSSKK
jgi:hypothetical protein